MRKDGAGQEFESPLAGHGVILQDLCSRDVRRHEVGGKLYAPKGQVHAARERADEECFSETGNAFEYAVAAREDGHEDLFHHVVLPYDNLAEFTADGVIRGGDAVNDLLVGRRCDGFYGGDVGHAGVLPRGLSPDTT